MAEIFGVDTHADWRDRTALGPGESCDLVSTFDDVRTLWGGRQQNVPVSVLWPQAKHIMYIVQAEQSRSRPGDSSRIATASIGGLGAGKIKESASRDDGMYNVESLIDVA
jgi:hypothetical protein